MLAFWSQLAVLLCIVTPYVLTELGDYYFRLWDVTKRHQAITRITADWAQWHAPVINP